MRESLRLGTALYGSAVLFDRLLGLLLLPLLARALAQADYGAWSQTAVAAGMLMPLVGFAFSTAIVRSFSGDCGGRMRRRYFVRLGAVVLALFTVCAAAVTALGGSAARLVYGSPAGLPLLPSLLLLLGAEVGLDFALAWLRAVGRMGMIAALTAGRSALRYGVVLVLVAGGAPPLARWLGVYAATQLALALAALVAAWVLLRRSPEPAAAPAAPALRELLRFSAPLVLLALFTALNASVDRFLLVQVLGLDGVAVYSAAAALCGIPGVFYSVLGFTLFPVLARHWNAGERSAAASLTDRALQLFAYAALPLALWLAAAGPALLPLVAAPGYRAPWIVFALLGAAVLAFGMYQITLYALLLDGRSHQVLALAVGAAALNALLNLMLAPRLGATGAAAAAAASNGAMVLVASRLARGAMPWRFPWARLWTLLWRAVLAALPLAAWAVAGAGWAALVVALAAAALLHLLLDLAHAGSVARPMLRRTA